MYTYEKLLIAYGKRKSNKLVSIIRRIRDSFRHKHIVLEPLQHKLLFNHFIVRSAIWIPNFVHFREPRTLQLRSQ